MEAFANYLDPAFLAAEIGIVGFAIYFAAVATFCIGAVCLCNYRNRKGA